VFDIGLVRETVTEIRLITIVRSQLQKIILLTLN